MPHIFYYKKLFIFFKKDGLFQEGLSTWPFKWRQIFQLLLLREHVCCYIATTLLSWYIGVAKKILWLLARISYIKFIMMSICVVLIKDHSIGAVLKSFLPWGRITLTHSAIWSLLLLIKITICCGFLRLNPLALPCSLAGAHDDIRLCSSRLFTRCKGSSEIFFEGRGFLWLFPFRADRICIFCGGYWSDECCPTSLGWWCSWYVMIDNFATCRTLVT